MDTPSVWVKITVCPRLTSALVDIGECSRSRGNSTFVKLHWIGSPSIPRATWTFSGPWPMRDDSFPYWTENGYTLVREMNLLWSKVRWTDAPESIIKQGPAWMPLLIGFMFSLFVLSTRLIAFFLLFFYRISIQCIFMHNESLNFCSTTFSRKLGRARCAVLVVASVFIMTLWLQ